MGIDHDPSIEHEPQWAPRKHSLDPSEMQAERILAAESKRRTAADVVEHTVWDEPALSPELVGDDGQPRLTYADWLAWRIDSTRPTTTWLVTLLIVLAAGPWAILGALVKEVTSGTWGLIAVAVVAPIIEEVMKIAIALWVVEKRPYLFRWALQIMLCALAGGLAFAVLENLVYLKIYIPHPTATLVTVRWTVCVAMHVTCSLLAGFGLVRMWSESRRKLIPPDIHTAAPWLIAAICVHGMYNGAATLAEFAGWLPF